ncbi:MAG: hypothetical protein JST29_05475 [Bacteroidetes bacterium]|nr:hypothetical protein [Bacteroidota bacterium]
MKKYLISFFLFISFATNAQLKTPSKFVPNGTFATANATDISGANRVVFDTIMRNAIPYYLRDTLATMVYDITNNCLWRLSGGVSNINWIKISLGSTSIDWSLISNKPTLFNGDYNGLINKPSLNFQPLENQRLSTTSSPTFSGLTIPSLTVGYGGTNQIILYGSNTGHSQNIWIDQQNLKIGWGTDDFRTGFFNAGEGGGNAGLKVQSYNGNIYLQDQNEAAAKIVKGVWNGSSINSTYIDSFPYSKVKGKPEIPIIPTDISFFNNDVGYFVPGGSYSTLGLNALTVYDVLYAGEVDVSTLYLISGSTNRALILDNNSMVTQSNVTDTELSYLSGTTSRVQSQLNGKQAKLNGTGFVQQSGTTTSYQTLATVATTGDYNDLSNKPSYPSNVSSGNYTPSVGSWSNLDSFNVKECQYIRVGSVVNVSGMIEFYPSANGEVTAGLSLPISTGTNYAEKIAGTCASIEQPSTYSDVGSVSNQGSNTYRALIKYSSSIGGGGAIQHVMFTFTYTITAAP